MRNMQNGKVQHLNLRNEKNNHAEQKEVKPTMEKKKHAWWIEANPKDMRIKKTMTHKTYFIVNQYHLKVLIHVRYNNPLVMNFDDNFPQLFYTYLCL